VPLKKAADSGGFLHFGVVLACDATMGVWRIVYL
jgi:hypothetical protein